MTQMNLGAHTKYEMIYFMMLRQLSLADEIQACVAHNEFPDWEFLLSYQSEMSWPDFVERTQQMRHGQELPKGYVPATFLIAEVDGVLIGRASIRHELNTFLLDYGGHIGYGVRPAFRRRGYATEILRRSLQYIRELGVEDVLLTCFEENIGSASVIQACGGELENIVEFKGKPLHRYWIRKEVQ